MGDLNENNKQLLKNHVKNMYHIILWIVLQGFS